MKSDKSWQREEAAVREAEALAELANLEPADVETFVKNHPNFVPSIWWNSPAWSKHLGIHVPWERERDRLRDAWATEFPANKTLELTANGLFMAAHTLEFETTDEAENAPRKIWPYQRAVLFLHVDSWRAKTCEWCNRRFIGTHSQARFCLYGAPGDPESTCFAAHRKPSKAENWNENSDRLNAERRQKYRAEKEKESHAKRQSLRQR
jgi:hypothetical protein